MSVQNQFFSQNLPNVFTFFFFFSTTYSFDYFAQTILVLHFRLILSSTFSSFTVIHLTSIFVTSLTSFSAFLLSYPLNTTQHSDPYIIIGLTTILKILPFKLIVCFFICLLICLFVIINVKIKNIYLGMNKQFVFYHDI